jgi:hypothetical protein
MRARLAFHLTRLVRWLSPEADAVLIRVGQREILIPQASHARYWRNAYETLVTQTGRDLNDGLGHDPRLLVRVAAAYEPIRLGPPGWPHWEAYSVWRIQGLLEAVNRWRDRALEMERIAKRALDIAAELNGRLRAAQLVGADEAGAEIARGIRPAGERFKL